MKFSVLDLFGRIDQSNRLVGIAERCGYYRYWVGEHHGGTQCSNPILVAQQMLLRTSRIRVGSGGAGVLYRSSLRLSEDACLVAATSPDRFDLGLTRGGLDEQRYCDALLDGRTPPNYASRIIEIYELLTNTLPDTHPLADHVCYGEVPPMWVLGVSEQAACLAASLGVGFCFSLHHVPSAVDSGRILAAYSNNFRARNHHFPEPRKILVVSGLVAQTADELRILKKDAEYALKSDGRNYSDVALNRWSEKVFVGLSTDWPQRITELADTFSVDEIMLLSLAAGDLFDINFRLFPTVISRLLE